MKEEGTQTLPAVVQGQKVKLFINRLVRSQYGEPLIEKMPIPVSIIATDLVTGDKVVFREGSLTQAMRATMSVPGLMAPVKDGERLLVDGGLVDNVPIDEVRRNCSPDVVIAVNVGSPLMKANEIGGIFSVAGQMINILTEQNVTRSLSTLGSGDIYIKPDLDGITAAEFGRYAETAKRGRAAAEATAAPPEGVERGRKAVSGLAGGHDTRAWQFAGRGRSPDCRPEAREPGLPGPLPGKL